jgi:hypothetical protein
VRFGTNSPTPWPPELPAGENPPPGGIIDYYLAKDASGPVKLEILDAAGKLVRSYSSDERILTPDPAVDPAAYNEICKRTPTAQDCALPLYWPAPQQVLSARAGAHRFSWDLHYDPIEGGGGGGGGGGGNGAVPHRTYPGVNSPWAPPGNYTVRLSADGKTYTQPLVLKLDPRVKTSSVALTQVASMTKEMHDGAAALHAAYTQARALVAELDKQSGDDVASFKAKVDSLAPPAPAGGGGRGGRGGGGGGGGGRGGFGAPSGPANLQSASAAMIAAVMPMQSAELPPTAAEVAAVAKAKTQSAEVLKKWNALKGPGLAALNAKRKAAGQPAITIPSN